MDMWRKSRGIRLPPEDLLATGDRDALASWFVAQKGINYSFQLIEDFLNDRTRIPPASKKSAPKTHSKGALPNYAEFSPAAHPNPGRTSCDGSRFGGRKTRKPAGTLHPDPDVCGTR